MFSRFVKDQSGATAIEYGLIASLIFLAALAAFRATGESVDEKWREVSSTIVEAIDEQVD